MSNKRNHKQEYQRRDKTKLRAYWQINSEKISLYNKQYAQQTKVLVLSAYSPNGIPKCECCGETHLEFLTLDHIHGKGNEHRRKLKTIKVVGGFPFYRWIIRSKYPPGYRVLCSNCNLAMGHYGYCPHKK